jgi:hypothetical protein
MLLLAPAGLLPCRILSCLRPMGVEGTSKANACLQADDDDVCERRLPPWTHHSSALSPSAFLRLDYPTPLGWLLVSRSLELFMVAYVAQGRAFSPLPTATSTSSHTPPCRSGSLVCGLFAAHGDMYLLGACFTDGMLGLHLPHGASGCRHLVSAMIATAWDSLDHHRVLLVVGGSWFLCVRIVTEIVVGS